MIMWRLSYRDQREISCAPRGCRQSRGGGGHCDVRDGCGGCGGGGRYGGCPSKRGSSGMQHFMYSITRLIIVTLDGEKVYRNFMMRQYRKLEKLERQFAFNL